VKGRKIINVRTKIVEYQYLNLFIFHNKNFIMRFNITHLN